MTDGPPPAAGRTAADLLAQFPVLRPPTSAAGAAVTLVLRDGLHGPETLLIERTTDAADPASGDVALPGGRVDEEDGSLETTALRELREEVGLAGSDLDGPLHFVGVVPAPRFHLHVGVFAAKLADVAAAPVAASPSEVAHVFWLPAGALADSRSVTRDSGGDLRQVLATAYDGHVVWGFTRRVVRTFFGYPVEDAPEGPVLPAPPPSMDEPADQEPDAAPPE